MQSRHAQPKKNHKFGSVLFTACMCGIGTSLLAPQALAAPAQPVPVADGSGHIKAPARTQISYDNIRTGTHVGTANENESRAGLSLVKLYIAEYVVTSGDPTDHGRALTMIRVSDDGIASALYKKYPQSINEIATRFGLRSTRGAAHWGNSVTSTADVNKYLVTKKKTDPQSPVLRAMREASPQAADGYRQDYGTSRLPGVHGTKFGWSDDRRTAHASASFGEDFVISAHTMGTKEEHSADVRGAFRDEVPVQEKPIPAVPVPAPIEPAPKEPVAPSNPTGSSPIELPPLELPPLPDLPSAIPPLFP